MPRRRSNSRSSSAGTMRSARSARSTSSGASSVGSSLALGPLSLHGGANLAEHALPASDPAAAAEGFARLLEELQRPGADPRSVRQAACCAALVETARERRTASSNASSSEEATPNEVFVAALAALSSLQSSLEAQQQSEDADVATMAQEVENTALPLLEILRRLLPYVAHHSNNRGALLAHQFGPLSRMLRLFVALGHALPSGADSTARKKKKGAPSSAGQAGGNALLRQVLKVSTTLLLVAPPSSVSEKDLARLLHTTIVPLFHDPRPKVRKAAWGCGTEIVAVASMGTSSSATVEDEGGDAEWARRLGRQRQSIADFVWEYCHAIVANYEPGSKEMEGKLVRALRFLAAALPFADDGRIRVRFGEGCLQLMDGGEAKKGEGSLEVVREALLTVLACLEATEREQELDGTEGKSVGGEEMPKFAARALAFLLQHKPSASNASYGGGDVGVVYGRCLLACMERMLGNESNDDGDEAVAPSKLLALKLLPNALASTLHLCEDGDAADGGGETCGAEFNRFVSRTVPSVAGHLSRSDSQLRRVALEVLPQCVPILQQATQIKYRNAWGSILPGGYATFVSTLAAGLLEGKFSDGGDLSGAEDQLQSWIKALVAPLLRLHGDVAKDGASRTAVEYAASTIVRGTGAELFLSVVDFVDDDAVDGAKGRPASTTGGGVRDDRAWLLPLMKQSAATDVSAAHMSITSKTHLAFFQSRVLNLARRCDAASADGHRTAAEASIQKARVVELWSLFPAFCACPLDVKENFATVAKTVVRALGDHGRYPKLIPIICSGLKTLAVGVMERAANSSSAGAKGDYDVLSSVSTKIIPSLFKLVETLNQSSSVAAGGDSAMDVDDSSSKEVQSKNNQQNAQLVEAVTDAIGQLARITPSEFLQTLFKKVVQRLLQATSDVAGGDADEKDAKNAATVRTCSLLGLSQALVASGSLDDASLSLLYRAVKPLVRSDEHDPRVQKRAYKVLAELCERHKEFVTADERLGEMVDLMVDSIVTCQVSARHMRLKCMTHIVEGLESSNEAHMAVIPKVMGEVLLCLKDSNSKTRESAYQLLLAMATARDDMTDFFRIILAAMGAQTTHMRSAAVMALSRLTFEYARDDPEVQSLLPSLMQTVAVLFDDASREVTKSVIGFVRVSVAAMTPEQLEPLLPEVVGGLMKYNKGKDRFRAKIKIILKKLVRVYGYDAIVPLVPEKDSRLITHMRKLSERAARRKAAGVQDGRSVAHDFDDMMESDEDDSDDGRTFMTGVTGFTKMTAMSGKASRRSAMERSIRSKSGVSDVKTAMTSRSAKASGPRIKAELNGEILDLLDSSKMARSVRFADMDMGGDGDFGSDDDDGGMDDMQYDTQGRIVISDGPLPKAAGSKHEAEDFDSEDENEEIKSGGKRRRVSRFELVKLAKAEKDAAKLRKQKSKKEAESSLGAAYKSKKAGGDVKKKGQKYEPYAYVPLNAKDFTKKNRGKSVSKMGTVVRNSKRKRS
ncbi:hypothetical protein ACHAXT_003261 [Thalassiosira profunda]